MKILAIIFLIITLTFAGLEFYYHGHSNIPIEWRLLELPQIIVGMVLAVKVLFD